MNGRQMSTITQLAKDIGISHNTIRRHIKANKNLHAYVEFVQTFAHTRINILDYEGLKTAIIQLINC